MRISIGIHKDQPSIRVAYPGSTVHWPKKSFDNYTWYRLTLGIPSNFSRPKVKGWQLVPRQEVQ